MSFDCLVCPAAFTTGGQDVTSKVKGTIFIFVLQQSGAKKTSKLQDKQNVRVVSLEHFCTEWKLRLCVSLVEKKVGCLQSFTDKN